MWAAGYGHEDLAALLLGRGATVDAADDRGRTALIAAESC
jgi:ankyrin repeat protein